MSVASEQEIRQLEINQPGRVSIFASAQTRRSYIVTGILFLGLALRLYGIRAYSLAGDEFGTIIEAKWLGLNWNSIIYSTLMHFWVRLGDSDAWLRLPAALFGVAAMPVIFKIGQKLGGWRTGAVAAVLAATSPFSIYHSQEVRFYSLFMLAAATFMLASISYIDSKRSTRDQITVALAGLFLVVSHFVGVIALYAQSAATFLAMRKRSWVTRSITMIAAPLFIFGLPLILPIRNSLVHLYQSWGNAWNADVSMTRFSFLSLAKLAFAGYTLVFGYHVYPLFLILVIPGTVLCLLLVTRGAMRLWKEQRFAALPVTYLFAAVGIYLVLDALGGRLASGVAPRHASFVWPALIVLMSLGLSSFSKRTFPFLLVAVLSLNVFSLRLGWQKDWTYGVATDYRAGGAYAAASATSDAALIVDGRAFEALDRYFPKNLPLAPRPEITGFDKLSYQRLILVTNDWRPDERRESNRLFTGLVDRFTVVDGRVDYPLFEYVMERKAPSANAGYELDKNRQLALPPSIYPIQFQDLKLPVAAPMGNATLKIIGAYALPTESGSTQLDLPLQEPISARQLILLTNTTELKQMSPDNLVAEVTIENRAGGTNTFPLRLNQETADWSGQCPQAACRTVVNWHKRVAMAGQNRFPDAWRDFQAGIHAAAFDLPASTEVRKISIRYSAQDGHIYLWGLALH